MPDNNFYSNFTERQRIKTEDAVFHVDTFEGKPISFSTLLSLKSYDFQPTNKVIVDVYTSSTNSRLSFDECGTIADMRQIESMSLDRMEMGSQMKFTVKVVNPDDFTIQGLIEGISTYQIEETGSGRGPTGTIRKSLLPVNYGASNMGQVSCRLRFEDDSPYLDINNSIEDARSRLVDSDHFRGVLFPFFVEDILRRAIHDLGPTEVGDGDGWQENWIRFATDLTGVDYPGDSNDEINDWVDFYVEDVAKLFAENHNLKNRLDDYLYGGDRG